jgi:tetratricopeptide (TPR) repeat protein
MRTALAQERATLLTQRFEAELAAGRHATVLSELTAAVTAHPLAEPLAGLLMLALYRSGRQADALAEYARARRRLADELGEDPGPALRELHERILRHDPALGQPPGALSWPERGAAPAAGPGPRGGAAAGDAVDSRPGQGSDATAGGVADGAAAGPPPGGVAGPAAAPEAGSPGSAASGGVAAIASGGVPVAPTDAADGGAAGGVAARRPVVRPAQLPADVRGFSGREAHLARLDASLTGDGDPGGDGVTTIVGTAGVGKTTLAVHWAHRVAHRFPDGQLYANLRGFDETGSVVDPSQALRDFLAAFGIPADQMPTGADALAGMFRSVLAGRRVLIVLDNARDAAQIRPLLPGTPGCLAVVTSRDQLAGLVAATGASQHALDLFTPHEARRMLATRLGADRLRGQEQAVAEILARCARLPLALSIVAAHAATRPDFPLTTIVAQLREAGGGLDTVTLGQAPDVSTDIRAVFSWSYRTLSPEAARLFRLLGLHPGPDLGVEAAASLAGLPAPRTRQLLAELTARHLTSEDAPGRFTHHDLLRHYAAELVHTQDTADDRHDAVLRLLDYYLHSLHAANDSGKLSPIFREEAPPAPPTATPGRFDDVATARGWIATERRALIAAVHLAAGNGFDDHAARIGHLMSVYLDRRGHWHESAELQHVALPAAQRLDDPALRAQALADMGRSALRLGRFEESERCLEDALALFRTLDDPPGQARVLQYLGYMNDMRGNNAEGIRYARRTLEVHRATGNEAGQCQALNQIGWLLTLTGNHEQALVYCGQALDLLERRGEWWGAAATLDSLAHAHRALGDWSQAIACLERAIELHERPEAGDRVMIANALTRLGETLLDAGKPEAARRAWERALRFYEEVRHPRADELRARLPREVVRNR